MKNSTKLSIAAAALSGLLMGTAARAATITVPSSSKPSVQKLVDAGAKAIKLDDTKKDVHECAGKNSCKNNGGCKTGDNGCKGKNSCKGKGGCAVKEDKK